MLKNDDNSIYISKKLDKHPTSNYRHRIIKESFRDENYLHVNNNNEVIKLLIEKTISLCYRQINQYEIGCYDNKLTSDKQVIKFDLKIFPFQFVWICSNHVIHSFLYVELSKYRSKIFPLPKVNHLIHFQLNY